MKKALLGPLAFCLIYFLWQPPGLSAQGHATLALTAWMAIWWISEALPMGATALLPLVFFPLFGISSISQTSSVYSDPIIFLFLGGFMLALAIERWNLHRRVALAIVSALGANISRLILGFMLATAILSMWISNTATTLMMLPIGVAIIDQMQDEALADLRGRFAKALLLGIAYSASIGGIATLIGTPTNAIMVSVIRSEYGEEIGFASWFFLALPVSVLLLILCWLYLLRYFKLQDADKNPVLRESFSTLEKAKRELGSMSWEEKAVALVFASVAFSWIARPLLQHYLGPGLNDSSIALFGVLVLFVIPAKNSDTTLLNWATAVRLPWEILLLFGGGFALATGFRESGLSVWLGSGLSSLQALPLFFVLLLVVAALNFLTEVTSNMATISMMLPILASMAADFDVHPYLLMAGASCAASCAFMLPIATAPNAIVFGSGHLQMKDMALAGMWLNLLSVLVLTVYFYLLMPLLWGIDIHSHIVLGD